MLAGGLTPTYAQTPVMTSGGAANRLPKWTGSSTLGNSVMAENGGRIGIGTGSPTDKLTVVGTIRSTTGGFRFPDGTVQTTAATGGGGGLSSVAHDATLQGNGTSGSPLRVAVPLNLTTSGSGTPIALRVTSAGSSTAVSGSSTGAGTGVVGASESGTGVEGFSTSGAAVIGTSGLDRGVVGASYNFQGVHGVGRTGVHGLSTHPDGYGVFGECNNGPFAYGVLGASATGYAGFFWGKVNVLGTLTKSGGSFKIDHPLDPENKTLSHSFVESPDMMNIYNGNAVLDGAGEAVVELSEWFGALNRDFRYQLTPVGGFAPVYVAEEIADNRFRIAGGEPGLKVSWQVTGIRQDAWANRHRIPVEEEKPDAERGHFLHPEAFDQPEEKGVEWARRPEAMRRLRAERASTPSPDGQTTPIP
jgi:hypothetical protein